MISLKCVSVFRQTCPLPPVWLTVCCSSAFNWLVSHTPGLELEKYIITPHYTSTKYVRLNVVCLSLVDVFSPRKIDVIRWLTFVHAGLIRPPGKILCVLCGSDSSADMWFDCCCCSCGCCSTEGAWCRYCCRLRWWNNAWFRGGERLLGDYCRPALYHQLPTLGGLLQETLQPELVYTLTVHDQIGSDHRWRDARVFPAKRRNDWRMFFDAFLEAFQLATESAVLAKRQHVALVLDARYAVVILVARCEHLIWPVDRLSALFRVLRSVVPQKRHHHFSVFRILPQMRHLGHVRQLGAFTSRPEQHTIPRSYGVPFGMSHRWVARS